MIVFSKRMLPALLASALPFAAQAMEGFGQGGQGGQSGQGQWSQQQQCAPCVEIVKPPVAEPNISCVQTKNVVTYEWLGTNTIRKQRWRHVDCHLTQHTNDGNCGENCYQVDKICPPDVDQACQSNQNNPGQNGDQYQCSTITTQPIHSDWKVVANGTKTGVAKWLNYTEEELRIRRGDSCLHHNACQQICAEEFLADLAPNMSGTLTLEDAKWAIEKVLNELAIGGKLTYVDGKRSTDVTGSQGGQGGGQGGQVSTSSKVIEKRPTHTRKVQK